MHRILYWLGDRGQGGKARISVSCTGSGAGLRKAKRVFQIPLLARRQGVREAKRVFHIPLLARRQGSGRSRPPQTLHRCRSAPNYHRSSVVYPGSGCCGIPHLNIFCQCTIHKSSLYTRLNMQGEAPDDTVCFFSFIRGRPSRPPSVWFHHAIQQGLRRLQAAMAAIQQGLRLQVHFSPSASQAAMTAIQVRKRRKGCASWPSWRPFNSGAPINNASTQPLRFLVAFAGTLTAA